ncbi:MAG: hypothetical protein WCA93_01855 [Acidimicrobiia bacterium]
MDERRAAADTYRLARNARAVRDPLLITDIRDAVTSRFADIRDAVGHRLIALGRQIAVHQPQQALDT